jgi:amino acid transporter
VCAGVWYLRVKEPNRPRPFKTPFVPPFPILGILSCVYLMTGPAADSADLVRTHALTHSRTLLHVHPVQRRVYGVAVEDA